MMLTSKHHIKSALLAYGEEECAQKVDLLSDEHILKIANKSVAYINETSSCDKMLALAAVEYIEGRKRNLKGKPKNSLKQEANEVHSTNIIGKMLHMLNKK
jgi:hypothetical protein